MKHNLILTFVFALAFLTYSCGNDDDDGSTEVDFEYQVLIQSPSTDDKHVNDTLEIEVDFESQTGMTVHHANIRIFSRVDSTEIYNQPSPAHVHETDGKFEFEDTFILSNSNGVMEHTDWILEAKVWAHETGLGEVIESVQFHVHPE